MSTLNQAFIKAYAKETSRSGSQPPNSPGAAPSEQDAATDAKQAAARRLTAPADGAEGACHLRIEQPPAGIDDAAASIPPPHVQFPAGSEPPSSPHHVRPPQTNDGVEEAAEANEPTAVERPQAAGDGEREEASAAQLSDSPADAPAAQDADAPPAEDEFSAAWEVDRFAWPAVCERLLNSEKHSFTLAAERLLAAAREGLQVLAITSSRRGEGRTTLALCLARCAAAAGVRVALLDADFENPQLERQLGLEAPSSWLQVVSGQGPLAEAAIASLEDRLTVLPLAAGHQEINGQSIDECLAATLRRAAAAFELVIVDLGPLAGTGFAALQTSGAAIPIDASIVVWDSRHATQDEAVAAAAQVQAGGIDAVGIAENFAASAS